MTIGAVYISFRVYLENGKVLTVRKVDDVGKLSREAAERSIGKKLTDAEWANFQVRGAWTITSSDGRRTDTYGLIRLVNGEADSATLRNEMLHAARSLGLITKAEWQALKKKYAPESKTDGHADERIAAAFEVWRGPEGLWQRLTSASTACFRVLVSSTPRPTRRWRACAKATSGRARLDRRRTPKPASEWPAKYGTAAACQMTIRLLPESRHSTTTGFYRQGSIALPWRIWNRRSDIMQYEKISWETFRRCWPMPKPRVCLQRKCLSPGVLRLQRIVLEILTSS
jgi:hypothetical protein